MYSCVFSSSFTSIPIKHNFCRADHRCLVMWSYFWKIFSLSLSHYSFLERTMHSDWGIHIKLYNKGDLGTLRVRHTGWIVLSRFWDDILKLLFHCRLLEILTICRCLTLLHRICNWHIASSRQALYLFTQRPTKLRNVLVQYKTAGCF